MTLEKQLNVQVANWSVLYTKLHHYHWFVKGPMFFGLHEKFEDLYDEAKAVVDEAAERLLAVGGTPISTLKDFLATATIEEVTGEPNTVEMVTALVEDYKVIKTSLLELADVAEKADDIVTADFAIDLVGKIDLHVWMFTAYLAK